MKKIHHYRRYVLIFAAPILMAAMIFGFSYLILARAGETIGPVAAAKIQQTQDVRFSSALFYRPRPYKIERAKLAKADIILLGSSRAMQFVKDPWLASAFNAGGAMRDLESGEIFVNDVLATYRPKQMIIILDWWWFSTARQADLANKESPETPITLHELLQPAVWLRDGHLTLEGIWQLIFLPSKLRPGIGIPALFRDAGWDAFGHYDYGNGWSVAAKKVQVPFDATLQEIARRSKRNDAAPWLPFSDSNWQRLEALVRLLQENDVETILILPPVAPPIYDWLASQPEPNLVNEIRRRLTTLSTLTFDFHDPHSIGTDACEFVDGLHGGEVSYLRLLDAVAADPSAHLESAVDRNLIQRLIAENTGHAAMRHEGRPPEADFNGLGCQK